jgi:hypothetical protein
MGVVVLLLSIVIYGVSPMVIAQVLKWKIGEYGYEVVEMQVGYPTRTSITFGPLMLQGTSAGRLGVLRVDKIVVEYTLPLLIKRRVENISIQEASLDLEAPQETSFNFQEPFSTPRETALGPSLTLGAILHPIPSIPVQTIELGKFVLKERKISKLERVMEVAGEITQDNGIFSGILNIMGAHIPASELSFQGTSLADVQVSLHSTQRSDSPALNLSSVLTENNGTVALKGNVELDVAKIIPYIEPLIPLYKEIQSVTGNLQAFWTGVFQKSVSLPSLVNHPEGKLDGTIRLALDIPQIAEMGKDLSIKLDSQFSVKNNQVVWNMSKLSSVTGHVNLDELPLSDHMKELHLPSQIEVTLVVKEPLHGEASWEGEMMTINFNGQMDLQVQTQDPAVRVRTSLLEGSIKNFTEIWGKGTFDVSGSWPGLVVESGSADSTQWDCGGEWNGSQQKLQAKIVQGCVLTAKGIWIEKTNIPQLRVTVLQPLELAWDGNSQNWQVNSTKLQLQMPQINWESQTIVVGDSFLQLQALQGKARSLVHTRGEIVVLGITLPPLEGIQIPSVNGKLGFVGSAESITVNGLGQIPKWKVTTKVRARQLLTTNEGGAVWAVAPVIFSPTTITLSHMMTPWPHPFDVTSGQVSATGEMTWVLPSGSHGPRALRYQGGTTVQAAGLSGYVEKILVEGLSVSGTVHKRKTWVMPEPAMITINTINPGIPVHDISMKAKIIQDDSNDLLVHIQNVVARTLGGTVAIDELSMDSVKRTSDFTVEVNQFQLDEILKLEQQEGLDGTGVLDGSLPVHVSMEGVEINQGTVQARPSGGVIHFQASPETAQTLSQYNVNMDIVLEALKNFHYEVLDVQINCDQAGRLVLHMKLQGKNPDFKNGRPIHFNLQVEENIPALLQSLQITKGIEEQIEKLFQEGCCY